MVDSFKNLVIPLNAIVTIVRSAPLKLTCNGACRQNEAETLGVWPSQILEPTMELGEAKLGFIYSNYRIHYWGINYYKTYMVT